MSGNPHPNHAGHRPPTRRARPGEVLFLFRDAKQRQIDCELRDHGVYGVEAMFLEDREVRYSRRSETRAQALQWAELERQGIEKSAAEQG